MVSGLQPISAKSYISLHPGLGLRDPPLWGLETHFCRWRSPRSSLGCGGTRTSHLRNTSVCWRHNARRLSTSSEWSFTWNGEGTETHSWCCTVALYVPSLTMVELCMAQHQTPTYDNWTASITRFMFKFLYFYSSIYSFSSFMVGVLPGQPCFLRDDFREIGNTVFANWKSHIPKPNFVPIWLLEKSFTTSM